MHWTARERARGGVAQRGHGEERKGRKGVDVGEAQTGEKTPEKEEEEQRKEESYMVRRVCCLVENFDADHEEGGHCYGLYDSDVSGPNQSYFSSTC